MGSRSGAKHDVPIPVFCKEINALGDIRGEDKLALDFAMQVVPQDVLVEIHQFDEIQRAKYLPSRMSARSGADNFRV